MANPTAYDIIKHAYEIIGMYNPDETLSGSETSTGHYHLNNIIESFQSGTLLIPYQGRETFNLVADQETYIFSPTNPNAVIPRRIAELTYVNIQLDHRNIPIKIITQSQYNLVTRFTGYTTVPEYVIFRNEPIDSTITFYPTPDKAYECIVTAKFALEKLNLYSEIITLPPHYHAFLIYALGKRLATIFKATDVKWSAKEEVEYQDLYDKTIGASDINLQLNLTPTLYKYSRIYNRKAYW